MVRASALLLTVLTGATGLVYEVTWQRYLATLLGSHAEATAAVLGIFLGGLAVGYSVFGHVTRRLVEGAARRAQRPPLLLTYGLLEAGIGLYAWLFPLLFRGAQAVSLAAPWGGETGSFAFDVGLAALLIGPGSVLMGGTIPMLTQGLARSLDDATRIHSLVYAFNTVGAFAGALSAGFFLVPWLGLVGVLHAMGALNLLAGIAFVAMGWRARSGAAPRSPGVAPRVSGFALFAGIALLVGFAMMTVQTVLIRLGAVSFGSSQFTFSMVVAVFVLCIALGSFAVSALSRIPSWLLVADLWGLVILLYLLYGALDDSPYWAHALRTLFRDSPAGFYPFYFSAFVAILVTVGPAVALSGATLPLLFHQIRREVGDLGNVAGRLYSWNTLGSFLGAILGGYWLFAWLDLHEIFALALGSLVVSAAIANARLVEARLRPVVAVVGAGALGAVALLPDWDAQQLMSGVYRKRQPLPVSYAGPERFFSAMRSQKLVFYDDDPTASIGVRESPSDDGRVHRSLVNNGKSEGAVLNEYVTTAMISLVPALLAERAERAFVVGYGTGVTVGEFAALDSAREVVVAEISPAVLEAAPLFDYANLQASQNPKVRMLRSDAYRALLRSEGTFDVIASEPSNPWVTGVEMLYSREFLEAARDRLSPGGVFGQWLHTYETDAATIALVLRTYADVFDHVSLWYTLGYDLLLLGFRDADLALDVDRLARRVARPDFAAALRRCGITGLPALVAHEIYPLGVLQAADLRGPLHTLLHPRLSHVAARAFFLGSVGSPPSAASLEPARVGARHSLLRRLAARHGGSLPEPMRAQAVRETCRHRPRECTALLAEWAHEVPASRARQSLVHQLRTLPEGDLVKLDLVGPLATLYGGAAGGDLSRPLAAAERATEHFRRYYHHAAPFSRRALADLWRRCEGPQRERCAQARARAERMLGNLNEPAVPAAARQARGPE